MKRRIYGLTLTAIALGALGAMSVLAAAPGTAAATAPAAADHEPGRRP